MAQIFRLNSTALTRVTRGDWADDPAGSGLDGSMPRQRWVRHTWGADVLSAAEYDLIFAQEGQRVTITTPDYADRNGDYVDYFGALCQRVSGQHEGPVVVGVTAEFLVRL
jgi:hypothetical protein